MNEERRPTSREILVDLVCLVGIGCIVTAGFLVYIPLGLVLLGAPMIAIAFALRKPAK